MRQKWAVIFLVKTIINCKRVASSPESPRGLRSTNPPVVADNCYYPTANKGTILQHAAPDDFIARFPRPRPVLLDIACHQTLIAPTLQPFCTRARQHFYCYCSARVKRTPPTFLILFNELLHFNKLFMF